MEEPHEHQHSITDHFKPKTIIASLAIAIVVAAAVYGSYNFYLSLNRYESQNQLVKAIAAEEDGDYVEAISIRNEVLIAEPNDPENLLSLASLFYTVNDYDNTLEMMRRYQDNAELTANGRLLLGKTYLKVGSIDLAQEQLQAVVDATEKQTEPQFLLGLIRATRKTEGADTLFTNAINSDHATSEMTEFYATWQEAQSTENENYADSLVTFGLLEIEQPYLALELINPVVELIPKYRDAHYLQAAAFYKTGQYEKALASVQKALEIDKEHAASKELIELIEEELPPTPTTTE